MASGNLQRWILRNSKPLPAGDMRWWLFRSMKLAQGKVCAALSMTIPGASMAMLLPGADMALSLPGASVALSLPGADIDLATPGASIELQDCSND